MLVQFGQPNLESQFGQPNWTRPTASSNFGCPRNFFSSNYFQIGQHVVLLHIHIRKSSSLVVKMSTSKPCHYVVLELKQEILFLLVSLHQVECPGYNSI